MEEVTAFRASDGKLFSVREQAEDYEFSLKWLSKIEEFTKTKGCPYPSGTQTSMMTKTIVAWEKFKTGAA